MTTISLDPHSTFTSTFLTVSMDGDTTLPKHTLDDTVATTLQISTITQQAATSTKSPVPPSYYTAVGEFKFYAMGVIVSLGLLLNILCIVVFLSSNMRRTGVGHYLVALAVADFTLLSGEMLWWLNTRLPGDDGVYRPKLGIDFIENSDGLCKVTFFLRYFGRVGSSWITVLVTFERFLAVVYPLHITTVCTTRVIRITLLCTACMSAAVSSYSLFTVGVQDYGGISRCLIYHKDSALMRVYDAMWWVLAVVGELVVPSLIVSTLTTAILYKLYTNRTVWRTRFSSVNGQKKVMSVRLQQERQLTRILVLIALAFVLLRLPYAIFYFINRADVKESLHGSRLESPWAYFAIHTTYTVAMCLSTVNYVINFFFYWFVGSSFRRELKHLVRRLCRRGTRRQPSHTGASYTNSTMYSYSGASTRRAVPITDLSDERPLTERLQAKTRHVAASEVERELNPKQIEAVYGENEDKNHVTSVI